MKKKIVFFAATVLITVIICFSFSRLVANKESIKQYKDFFDHSNGYDVWFLGSSVVKHGILPVQLYKEYRISSYNRACQSAFLPVTYWIFVNALDYGRPKIVVIDGYSISKQYDWCSQEINKAFDAFNLSINKIRANYDLCICHEDKVLQRVPWGEAELLFPYERYHNRWNEITQEDFRLTSNSEFGAVPLNGIVKEYNDYGEFDKNAYLDLGTNDGVKYLNKLVDLCERMGFEVVVTYCQTEPSPEAYIERNYLKDYAENRSISFIDCLESGIIDDIMYYYDGSHLNTEGAYILTDYIGERLKYLIDIPDARKDDNYSFWDDSIGTFE